MASDAIKSLILSLYEIEAVKFGKFTLKSGIESPIYFDLRVIVSYPKILEQVSEELWQTAVDSGCDYDVVCGVPYTALPMASCIAVQHNVPMVVRRKEAKDYGTKKIIEGVFKEGSKCLVIEDVVTSGSSVRETVEVLSKVHLNVTDAIVLLDRCQGGKELLLNSGVKLHSVLDISQVLDVLHAEGKLDAEIVNQVHTFIEDNSFTIKEQSSVPSESDVEKCLSFKERAELVKNPIAKQLLTIMHSKNSNLGLSLDVTSCKEALKLVQDLAPHVCLVKTHIDILHDFTQDFVKSLQELAKRHNFIIFEDRKFADIGNTVKHQYKDGIYRIADWADLVNAHSVPGSGVIAGLQEVGKPRGKACLLLGEMSSQGTLAKGDYTQATIKMAEEYSDFVIGFICTSKLSQDPQFIHMTPGVKLQSGGDNLGQQYLTPEEVIKNRGSDIILVGRGIYADNDPVGAAIAYKQAGYQAYLDRLGGHE